MGLDMYAYVANKEGQMRDYHESCHNGSGSIAEPRELAYWRKHPNLHGWMHKLWDEKGHSGDFNGDELELTFEDLDRLEYVIKRKELPSTAGFFFGNDSDDHYRANDLEFVKQARMELTQGMRVFYNSSW